MRVIEDNINPEYLGAYAVPEAGYVELEKSIPYDYLSVMQYGKDAFVKTNSAVSFDDSKP